MKKLIFGCMAALTMMTGQADAAIIASDTFSYTDGSLVGNGAWLSHSGTPGDLLVSGGAAVVQHGIPSEDSSLPFADQTTGVLTAAFDAIVSDDATIGDGGGTDFEYFTHFFTDGSFNFVSRVSIVAPNDPNNGDYTLGISSTSSAEEAILATDYTFGETVGVTYGFDLDTGIGFLTVGAETISGTSSSLGQTLNRFALRQSDSSNNEAVTVSNLVINGVAAVPEPSTLTALCIVGAGMTFRRRKMNA